MRLYETTFIVNPQSDDASIDRQVKAISDLIIAGGGKIEFEDRIGTRRLAYEIKGLTQGYYANFIFQAPSAVLTALDRHYRLEEPYVRYLTTLFEGDLEAIKDRRDSYAAIVAAPDERGEGREGREGRDGRDRRDRDDRDDRPSRGERRDYAPAAPVARAAEPAAPVEKAPEPEEPALPEQTQESSDEEEL